MSGERLWYRVGARMAARLEEALGRNALRALVAEGHRFFEVHRQAVEGREGPAPGAAPPCIRLDGGEGARP
jgi:hypothetical protein